MPSPSPKREGRTVAPATRLKPMRAELNRERRQSIGAGVDAAQRERVRQQKQPSDNAEPKDEEDYLGEIFFDNCVNVNGAPRMRTPSRQSGAWSCHAPGGDGCARSAGGTPVGVLRSAAHRRAESRFWGVFIIAVHRAFVLGLGARHRGIVELSEGG